MASFSVDISDIVFAGGRKGFKVVTISNAPAAGIGISNTGYGTHFTVVMQEQDVSYQIKTKSTNTSGSSYSSRIRFYNKGDNTDYVEIPIVQYSVTDIALYADNLVSTGTSGVYSLDLGYEMGSTDLYIDVRGDYSGYAQVTEGGLWLSVVQDPVTFITDTGFFHYFITYIKNTDSSTRTGQVQCTASGSEWINTIIVNQAGGAPVEELSVSPSSLSFGVEGGTSSIGIQYRGSSLSYDKSSVNSWIDISLSQVMSGVMSGVVTAATNMSTAQRSGNVYFSDVSGSIALPISQDGQAITLSAVPSSLSFTSSGGTKTTAVTFAGSLQTNAANMPEWLEQSYVSVDSSHRTYTVDASANNTSSSRSFSWIFQDDNMSITVPITQAAGQVASLSISPTSASVSSASGSVEITVTSSGISEVSYVINSGWIEYLSKSGSVYTFGYAENGTTDARQGSITFSGGGLSRTFTLSQESGQAASYSVSPSYVVFPNTGGKQLMTITNRPTYNHIKCDKTNADWVYSYGTSILYADINMGSSSKEGVVRYYMASPSEVDLGESVYIPVSQGGGLNVFVSQSTLLFDVTGGTQIVTIKYNNSFNIDTSSAPDWLSFSTDVVSQGVVHLFVTATSNTSTDGKSYTLGITGGGQSTSLVIKQMPQDVPGSGFSLSNNQVFLDDDNTSSGGQVVTYGSPYYGSRITYTKSDSWISVAKRSSGNNVLLTVTATNNTGVGIREGYVTVIRDNTDKLSFKVIQYGCLSDVSLFEYPESLVFDVTGGSKDIYEKHISTYGYHTYPDWITESYSSVAVYTYTASLNDTGYPRSGYIDFYNPNYGYHKYVPVYQAAGGMTVSPSSKNFSYTGGTQVFDIEYSDELDFSTLPSWLSGEVSYIVPGESARYTMTAEENTSTLTRSFNWVINDELTTVIVSISQEGAPGPGPGPTPVEEGSFKAFPKKLRYYSDGGSISVSFTNRPTAGIGYVITYTDGSGWLSVVSSGPDMNVSATANNGTRRRAEIKFYDLSDGTNYVIVPVIQGSIDGYNSIWMDDLYYPEDRDTAGNYFYRVVDQDTGQTYFTGVSSKPLSWSGDIGGIDVPRLVDNYIKSYYEYLSSGNDWADMHFGYCTVDIYNMTEEGYPGVVDETFKYWNDWSRFEKKYDYTRSLNDPINGKGCDNMIIPFCVYYDDAATFRIVNTDKNGSVNTYTLSSPSSPFAMRYNSYSDSVRVDYKQDNEVIFSYDMTHCGQGAFIYRNRFGGFDSFLVEGNISKTDNYTKQNYRIKGEYNQEYSIDTYKYIDEKRTDSIDIDTTYEAYTGWLTDEESERLAFHLLSSPIVYFQNLHKENQVFDTDPKFGMMPVRITASSAEYKKFRNGKRLVNYLITFEKCNIEKVRQ